MKQPDEKTIDGMHLMRGSYSLAEVAETFRDMDTESLALMGDLLSQEFVRRGLLSQEAIDKLKDTEEGQLAQAEFESKLQPTGRG